MPHVRFTVEAERDIDQIAAYTSKEWGWRQADQYLTKLEDGLNLLADNTSIGRPCDSIRKGLRRFEVGSHVIFYLLEPRAILIVRVLHERMLPSNYVSMGLPPTRPRTPAAKLESE